MERIPPEEVEFHPHSFADPGGKLFWWRGRLYRGLSSESAVIFKGLLEQGLIQRLADQGLLVLTEPTCLALDGYEMVVRHRSVPFPSYPEEWCPAMLKDAAIAVLDLLTQLAASDLTLKDCHPWNVLIDRGRPVYVDLTSIVPMLNQPEWRGHDEFCRFYVRPLVLMANQQDRIARRLMPEYGGVSKADLDKFVRTSAVEAYCSAASNAIARLWRRDLSPIFWKAGGINTTAAQPANGQPSASSVLKTLRREIERIGLSGTQTARLKPNITASMASQSGWTIKQRSVHRWLTRIRPGSVLDVGLGNGWYSVLAALLGNQVVSFDDDVQRVTGLYQLARELKLPIIPLVMDFADPTPARGLCSHWAIAATERLRCDLVLALGLVRDLVFRRSLNFDHIVNGLALFSKRSLIVEFISPEELQGSSLRSPSWYTLDNFLARLTKHFQPVEMIPSDPPSRVLILCEK